MPLLQRITSEYIESEDRIRLTGLNEAELTQSLWLTQRLLVKLLAHFLNWLEQEAPEVTGRSAIESTAKSVLQGIAQQSASQELTQQPAVTPSLDSNTWLVTEVDISSADEAVSLVFKSADGQQAELGFSVQQLRQWLGIIHSLWRQAQWPMALWPDWMDEEQQLESGETNSPLH